MTAPVRILLVEDNDGFREMLATVLGLRPDVDVVAAVGDGAEAVPACREHAPDVVLMDYRLPGLDGVQATRAVRALAGPERDVPIIALTANPDAEDAQGYAAAGMACVVEKPIRAELLFQALRAALTVRPDAAQGDVAAA